MKFQKTLCITLLAASTSVMAQQLETQKTNKSEIVKTNRIPVFQPKLIMETETVNQDLDDQKIKKNLEKSKAARAKRDEISAAVRKRLARSKKVKRQGEK